MIKELKRSKERSEDTFSILIPTWNNLPFLQLCIKSILKNSAYQHLRNLATTDYITFVNDDMYLCPDWDAHLLKEIKNREDDLFFFSGTLIEPTFSNNACAVAQKNYGSGPADFNEEKLLTEIDSITKKDWAGATWPPNIVSTRLWDLVGGYSTEFSPGMYSDPDFSKKLWDTGVRNFKGIGASKAYHFMSKSVGRVKRNDGRTQFLKKWRFTSSTFTNHYLRRGEDYTGPLAEPEMSSALKKKLFTSKLKRIFSS